MRAKHRGSLSIDSGNTLRDILEEIKQYSGLELQPDQIKIEHAYDYDGGYSTEAVWCVEETEYDFQIRLTAYELRLREWKEWRRNHKDQIDAVLEARKRKAEEKDKKKLEAEKNRLYAELQKLEKREKTLQKG